jgi:hypothetical protein
VVVPKLRNGQVGGLLSSDIGGQCAPGLALSQRFFFLDVSH